mmetsp:Transcript_27589/g.44784  ORF Transcript_27589/g.44784 Transcript_27589/m.44784 type:complete len:143 (-) Transcript_27589:170-598(-)
MSFFTRPIRHQAPRIQAFWSINNHHTHRCIATSAPVEMMDLLAPRGFSLPRFSPMSLIPSSSHIGAITITTIPTPTSIGERLVGSLQSLLGDLSTWLIKRTYQPSIIRKRRKHGFRRRKESVGGRRILKRRAAKGRIRLGGC